jgi:type IV pilus assembly protein PilB
VRTKFQLSLNSLLTKEQLQHVLEVHKANKDKKLIDILVDLNYVSEDVILELLSNNFGLVLADFDGISPESNVLALIPVDFATKYNVFPLSLNGSILTVAISDPMNVELKTQLRGLTGLQLNVQLASKRNITEAIEKFYRKHAVEEIATIINVESNKDVSAEKDEMAEIEERIGDVPVVKLINSLVLQAHQRRASDIHIEPGERILKIRFRIDGELIVITTLDMKIHSSLVTRVKIMAEMDIAERRIPLDGRMTVDVQGATLNIRANSMPTMYGEKIVLRINEDSKKGILPLERLGMLPQMCVQIRQVLRNPNGLILLSGPTGSGKSTTLYSMLNEVANSSTNVATIEDPVEKLVPGVNQTQTNPKAGLTFANGLRALLRQDPDKIMIGEIRDIETADIAARAAITGHLVFASIHTNSAAATYMRLVDMGVEPYIITSSLIYVVAQRLVKLICKNCKEEYQPDEGDLTIYRKLNLPLPQKFYIGRGCDKCENSGSYGRRAIHETVVTDEAIRRMVLNKNDTKIIEDYLKKEKNQKFLLDRALELVDEGTINVRELYALYQYEE